MNILLYVVDALRADHLSCYGYHRETSPNIDRFAKDAIIYERCFAPSTWTRASATSLLTGTYPAVHGVRRSNDEFTADIPTLSRQLSKSGFRTAGFNANGNIAGQLGFEDEFDEYFDLYKDEKVLQERDTKNVAGELNPAVDDRIALPRAEDVNNAFIEWLSPSVEPFFSLCWTIDPHSPYQPPPEYRTFVDSDYDGDVDGSTESISRATTQEDFEHLENLYDGEIRYVDQQFGELVAELKGMDLYEDTLVILLGDHGEGFNEHGLVEHGHAPYEEMVHIPLLVKPPSSFDCTPNSVDSIVSLVDLFPTLCEYLDLTVPDPAMGIPFKPFGGDESREEAYIEVKMHEHTPAFVGVRDERWKYIEVDPPEKEQTTLEKLRHAVRTGNVKQIVRHPIHHLKNHLETPNTEGGMLFDLHSDPSESINRIDSHSEVVASLSAHVDDWREECRYRMNRVDHEEEEGMDARTEEQLRQLGYIE